jgi:leucyl/phenylalanyl-tRNA--protein transferase
METGHMTGLGAKTVERDMFLDALHEALQKPSDLGSWQHFKWEYKD